ncbi:MAG: hypothetical protein KC478_06230 [Bacteriovoracaceae bacterium]|nr:hypothetical protein [Bacteriovoracaceae bacterium]
MELAPNMNAKTCSLTSPKILLQKVAIAIFNEESNTALEFANVCLFSKMLKQSQTPVNNINSLKRPQGARKCCVHYKRKKLITQGE